MNERIERLRRKHLRRNSDGFVSLDKATNEYLSGFSGSTSAVLITRKRAVFFT
ncbi:MAG: aminopeptidase P family N-terminal domain-containing protein, partial [Candidatus Hydrogenedentes bacterium]|nr:aminopeptidase P family N-terminal domain-containing protein [Candidatus Hydrogenedentota bacterium]